MAKKTPICPEHTPNEARGVAKHKRGYGQLAMAERGMTQAQWTQKHDPLFKVKGKERHKKMKGAR